MNEPVGLGQGVRACRDDGGKDWLLTDAITKMTFALSPTMAERFARLVLETMGWPSSETEADLEKINAGLQERIASLNSRVESKDIEIADLHRIIRETGERLQEAKHRLRVGSTLTSALLEVLEGLA